ncbi:MAG TPA: hypothetical protein VGK17_21375 [Propionicimonas sp.]|jgi:hypothetical protein
MLFDELSPEQVKLLEIVWQCIPLAPHLGAEPSWPTWDYVRRSLYRDLPDLEDAEALLRSLPSVGRPTDFRGRRYGLVWHEGHLALDPTREDRIGLTIAGLAVLARHDAKTSEIADALAQIISQAAQRDEQQQPKPFEVVQTELSLNYYFDFFEQQTRERPFIFPGRLVVEAFDKGREYPRLQVKTVGDQYSIELGWVSLRGFRSVDSAERYLAQIEATEAAQVAPVRYSSPLTLVQTVDYLGYVIAGDPRFPGWEHLSVAPNLQSAAALGVEVGDRAQYDSALSSLWNVIDQLRVPEVPAEAVASHFDGKQPRSLGRLRYWLEQRIDDEAAVQRARDAISVIQKVGRLRAEPQHTSTDTTRQAIKIRRELGLPDFVSDYRAAWDLIRDSVAGAFNVVRETIQQTA